MATPEKAHNHGYVWAGGTQEGQLTASLENQRPGPPPSSAPNAFAFKSLEGSFAESIKLSEAAWKGPRIRGQPTDLTAWLQPHPAPVSPCNGFLLLSS